MDLLANFKIRTKVIIALLPLAIMVIVAVLYSSDRMSTIDAGYSTLIDKDVNALQELTVAQSLNNLFGQILYKEIAETNSDRMQAIAPISTRLPQNFIHPSRMRNAKARAWLRRLRPLRTYSTKG